MIGKRFPSRIRNDLDKLWEDEGGPAQIEGVDRDRFAFGSACDSFPYADVAPLLREYKQDERSCRAHWPWVALAADLYGFDVEDRPTHEGIGYKRVVDMFLLIEDSARTLSQELERLRMLSVGPSDHKKPEARGHLIYLHELFKQQAIGDIDTDLVDDILVQMGTDKMHRSLVQRLSKVSSTAREFAQDRVNREMLTRSRGQDDAALPGLVFRLGKIWKSHTGRVASANKVSKQGDERSDFVRFVQSVVALANGDEPSRAAIQTALK